MGHDLACCWHHHCARSRAHRNRTRVVVIVVVQKRVRVCAVRHFSSIPFRIAVANGFKCVFPCVVRAYAVSIANCGAVDRECPARVVASAAKHKLHTFLHTLQRNKRRGWRGRGHPKPMFSRVQIVRACSPSDLCCNGTPQRYCGSCVA